MVEEVSLTHMIVQATIAVYAVEVFLSALITVLWSLVYLHRRRGKI
uniref:Pre-mRNA-splicing factor SF2 n=1 Tax=Arundo donax TaxID=35708 RepID=A0A0A9F902_ARUDO